jgi:hypothetical protein
MTLTLIELWLSWSWTGTLTAFGSSLAKTKQAIYITVHMLSRLN